jgi:hypothetical protein
MKDFYLDLEKDLINQLYWNYVIIIYRFAKQIKYFYNIKYY